MLFNQDFGAKIKDKLIICNVIFVKNIVIEKIEKKLKVLKSKLRKHKLIIHI